MSFKELVDIASPPKTIAVIGASGDLDKPGSYVPSFLHEHGFEIIPVNPLLQSFLGMKVYGSIAEIPKEINIDIVDIFRRPEYILQIVEEVIASGRKPIIWMQEGIQSDEAKELAEQHGMTVVMNKCMKKVYMAGHRA